MHFVDRHSQVHNLKSKNLLTLSVKYIFFPHLSIKPKATTKNVSWNLEDERRKKQQRQPGHKRPHRCIPRMQVGLAVPLTFEPWYNRWFVFTFPHLWSSRIGRNSSASTSCLAICWDLRWTWDGPEVCSPNQITIDQTVESWDSIWALTQRHANWQNALGPWLWEQVLWTADIKRGAGFSTGRSLYSKRLTLEPPIALCLQATTQNRSFSFKPEPILVHSPWLRESDLVPFPPRAPQF